MTRTIVSFLALAITAGCNVASRSADGAEAFVGYSDPSGAFSSGGEARYARAELERVRTVETQRARAAAESQDLAAQARFQVIAAMRRCLTGELPNCRVPPAAWTDIAEVSRGLAVDEAITVSASDSSGYGYGEGDGWWRAQAQMGGGGYAVPGWVSGNSQEVLQRLDQIEADQRESMVIFRDHMARPNGGRR